MFLLKIFHSHEEKNATLFAYEHISTSVQTNNDNQIHVHEYKATSAFLALMKRNEWSWTFFNINEAGPLGVNKYIFGFPYPRYSILNTCNFNFHCAQTVKIPSH